jgi:hypothetical protein
VVVPAGVNGGTPKRCAACAETYWRWRANERNRQWIATHPAKHQRNLDQQATRRADDPNRVEKRRDAHLYNQYGITASQFEAMAREQGDVCAICGNPPQGRGKGDTLVLDHCHKRGIVRGILCGKCNTAIGLLDDDAEQVALAAAYLRKWQQAEQAS